MKDLKFRVWHRKEQKMYYPGTYRLKFNRDHKWYVLINPEKAPESPKDVELMQFTGIQDANEVDVYESDVLIDQYGNKQKVVWADCGFYLQDLAETSETNLLRHFNKYLTVIGNLHELVQ